MSIKTEKDRVGNEEEKRQGESQGWRNGRSKEKRGHLPEWDSTLSSFLPKVRSPSTDRMPSWEMSRYVLAGEGWGLSFQSMNTLGFGGLSHLINVTLTLFLA